MALYKEAFGDNFELGFDLALIAGIKDKSYHNDVCPSFQLKTNTGYVVIWIDYENEDDRDSITDRYVVVTATNMGTDDEPEIYHDADSVIIFESECPNEALNFLQQKRGN